MKARIMRVVVLMLGPAKHLAGVGEVAVEVPAGARVAAVRAALLAELPESARGLAAMRIAVNQTFAADDMAVGPDDEVALIPPVSGG